ncbi:hypothetical protein HK100_003618 [Physocladia obscura]|uniref:Domain of unknown function at the cortex 1 domain-containing protein n=1 Tax=Physocladia obscura TaxID=109957 RepID=A0AAD5SUR2_9FUNG|nr:hypothetical protein HK100_003618 [Physocladia obscura]
MSSKAPTSARKLAIRVGSSLDGPLTHVHVNDDTKPVFVDGPFFVGNIVIRVRNFDGVTPDGSPPIQNISYFTANPKRKRLFSLQIQGRFKQNVCADDLVQGTIWLRKVRIPYGTSILLRVAQMVDSTFSHDLYSEKPSTFSTVLSSQNALSVERAPSKLPLGPISPAQAIAVLGKWAWGGETELVENNALLAENLVQNNNSNGKHNHNPTNLPFESNDAEPRRKYFMKKSHREGVTLSPEYVYTMESYSPWVDFNTFDVSMGITVNMHKYTNGQPHLVVFKDTKQDNILLVVEFRLVDLDPEGKPIFEDSEE